MNIFEREQMTEELARKIYEIVCGCHYPKDKKMIETCTHPSELACVEAAHYAIARLVA